MLTVDGSTFDRARRSRLYRRVVARLGLAAPVRELVALDGVIRRLRLSGQSHLGLRTIPVRAIIGTMDRAGDFDGEFLPRRPDMVDRWNRVERIVRLGQSPPIVVHELDHRYFIVDGHHRVAIARQHGIDHLEADVTRIRTQALCRRHEDARRYARPRAPFEIRPHGGLRQPVNTSLARHPHGEPTPNKEQ